MLITILEILNKSHEASFGEEIESFVGAFLQCLLAYLTSIKKQKIYSLDDSCDLRSQHKQVKTIKMNELLLDIYNERSINQF